MKKLIFAFVAIVVVLIVVDLDIDELRGPDTFDPSDGKAYCDPIPESIESLVNKKTANATLELLGKEIGDITIEKESSYKPTDAVISMAEYLYIDRSLCLDHVSKRITDEKYYLLKSKILPLLKKSAENIVGFSVEIVDVTFRKVNNEKSRAYIDLLIKSDSNNNETVGSLIYGLVMLHDESKVNITGRTQATREECHELTSCLKSNNQLASEKDPILIRGGNDPTREQIIVEFDQTESLKDVRVYVAYYQRETRRGGICTKDKSKISPETGIPYLKEISSSGLIEEETRCFYSRDRGTYKYVIQE